MEQVTKGDVHLFRFYRVMIPIFGVATLVSLMLALFKGEPHAFIHVTIYTSLFYFSLGALVVAMIILDRPIPKHFAQAKVIIERSAIYAKRPYKEFPFTAGQLLSEEKIDAPLVLERLAVAVNVAEDMEFKVLEALQASAKKLGDSDKNKIEELTNLTWKLQDILEDRDEAEKAVADARSDYLSAWNFYTKPFPDGRGILTGPEWQDPEKFRLSVES